MQQEQNESDNEITPHDIISHIIDELMDEEIDLYFGNSEAIKEKIIKKLELASIVISKNPR